MAGLIGQVRGFDLDEFLSDWEPRGEALPWTVGNGGWASDDGTPLGRAPSAAPAAPADYRQGSAQDTSLGSAPSVAPAAPAGTFGSEMLFRIMASEGVTPKLKVLYLSLIHI